MGNLTAADHLTTQYPYSFRAEWSNAYFFNFCNRNDGRTWSTPFLIDDTQVYVASGTRIQNIAARREEAARQRAEVARKNAEDRKKRTAQKKATNGKTTQSTKPAKVAPVVTAKQVSADLR